MVYPNANVAPDIYGTSLEEHAIRFSRILDLEQRDATLRKKARSPLLPP